MNLRIFKPIAAIMAALFAVASIHAQEANTIDEGVVINGVKWATRNVGKPGTFVANPEDAGEFYQWNSKKGVATYIATWWNKKKSMFLNPTYGLIIKTDKAWDKANDPCPAGWRLPTWQELKKLYVSDSEWTTRNGVKGQLFKSGDNTLFMYAAGVRNNSGKLEDKGSYGYYWSSSSYDNVDGCVLGFGYGGVYLRSVFGCDGFWYSCRCVAE